MADPSPVFVTGASGFIGGKLAERLLAAGRRVRALSRRPLPDLARRGAEVIVGDLHDGAALRRGCTGCGTVFHVAGRVGVWGPPGEFFRVNVEGTRRLLAIAQDSRVLRVVYTSSPSVVYDGGDLAGVDESAPLCTEAPCAYPTSKAAAEKLVLGCSRAGFATTALRPHLVWGPGDRNVVPRVLALAGAGRLRIVGGGRNRIDITHIENVVDAHLLAERAVDGRAAGRAYFITNGEPIVLWDWINQLLTGLGRPPVTKRISLRGAYAIGSVLETLWRVLPLRGEPPMTRFVAKEMATDHWFRIDAARRDLGYRPRVSLAEGTADLIRSLRAGGA